MYAVNICNRNIELFYSKYILSYLKIRKSIDGQQFKPILLQQLGI